MCCDLTQSLQCNTKASFIFNLLVRLRSFFTGVTYLVLVLTALGCAKFDLPFFDRKRKSGIGSSISILVILVSSNKLILAQHLVDSFYKVGLLFSFWFSLFLFDQISSQNDRGLTHFQLRQKICRCCECYFCKCHLFYSSSNSVLPDFFPK